ncbi:MAG: class I SAM-dependent methyltransferase [bacterium]
MEAKQKVILYEKTRYSKPDQWLVNSREKQIVRKILKKINLRADSLLDIPCGYGRFTSLFLKEGLSVTCSDLSKAMVDRCKENVTTDRPQENRGQISRFAVSDIRKLPFKENSFDCTFTFRLVQHIPSPEERKKLLQELSRVTRRWAIISFYRPSLFHILARKIRGLKHGINMLLQKEFVREAESCNLKVKAVYPIFPGLHAQVICLLEKSENPLPELF